MYLFLKKSYLNRVSFDQSALVKRTVFFLFSVCKGNSTLRSRQGLRKFGSEKILSSFAVRFFPLEPLTALRVPLWEWQGKKKKVCGYAVCYRCVYPHAACIYSKKCPCRTILAFLALLKKILRLPLWHGTKTERKDYIPMYRT